MPGGPSNGNAWLRDQMTVERTPNDRDRDGHVRIARPEDMEAVRDLCRAYRDVLIARNQDDQAIVEMYYKAEAYEELLKYLPGLHARPDGAIFAGSVAGQVVACGMTHRIDEQTVEIKRVYVDPAARGHGLAKRIFQSAMTLAAADGYKKMVLDTMVSLHEAIALYHKLGFREGRPFHDVDPRFKARIRFFEIDL